jgi:hypothetical protein
MFVGRLDLHEGRERRDARAAVSLLGVAAGTGHVRRAGIAETAGELMAETKRWLIPARIVEYRDVCVEAATKAEALQKFRRREWVPGPDPDGTSYEVYKVGAIEETDPGEW